MNHDQDTRRSTRVRIAAVATLETLGRLNANNQALAVVKNISRTGIGIETGQPPIRGQEVLLRLAIDDQMHELRTRATRITRRSNGNFYEVGLDWSTCSESQLAFLDEILRLVETNPLG